MSSAPKSGAVGRRCGFPWSSCWTTPPTRRRWKRRGTRSAWWSWPHLQSQATRDDLAGRYGWKIRLIKNLLGKDYSVPEVRQLFRLIDWLLDLPGELEQQCRQEIHDYAKEKQMPYVSSFERLAREEGRQEGRREELVEMIALVLSRKFGEEGAQHLPAIRAITDVDQLHAIRDALLLDQSLAEIRQLLPR